jgi:hypothetical protein
VLFESTVVSMEIKKEALLSERPTCIYITRLASNEIFAPSNKIHREVGLRTYQHLGNQHVNLKSQVGNCSLEVSTKSLPRHERCHFTGFECDIMNGAVITALLLFNACYTQTMI